jgi:folate-dependent phosphoribosylglycinamide formyltransferase PurN
MVAAMDRPIRVVFFGGAFPEHGVLQFIAAVATHPEMELVGGVCQSAGLGVWERLKDIGRRRGVLAPVAIGAHLLEAAAPLVRHPRASLAIHRTAWRAMGAMRLARDIHAADVLEYVRTLDPDLGLIYGSPILRPELFGIPRLGTLGIHHGTLPQYRGKKTTFWEVYNGEQTAGVVIQKVNERLDAGEIVARRDIPIAGKRYGRVNREVNEAGVELYVDAILSVRRGTVARHTQHAPVDRRIYREPTVRDWLHVVGRRFAPTRRRGAGQE